MEILLTNDDGIHAPGLKSLFQAFSEAGFKVHVVAPLTEQSAVGHSVTIFSPVRVKSIQENGFHGLALSGTPVDCVKWAMHFHLPKKPDFIISGINSGANVGIDVLYSGTVSAATEGALAGVPSLAVSIDHFRPPDLTDHAQWVRKFIQRFDWSLLPLQNVLNLNFPSCPLHEAREARLCPQTTVVYKDHYNHRNDPRGNPYYWLGGEIPMHLVDPEADRALLSKNHITLTPLQFELTNLNIMSKLQEALYASDF